VCSIRIASRRQRERHYRIPVLPGIFLESLDQLGFQVIRIGNHLKRCDLFRRKPLVTELANSQPSTFDAYGRSKRTARHWSRIVEITGALVKIQRRTPLIISETLELLALLLRCSQEACSCVSRKVSSQARDRFMGALPNRVGSCWITLREFPEAAPQARCIELVDREYTPATWRASFPTDEPAFTPAGRIRKRGIDDLNQFLITRSWQTTWHCMRILIS
jgi:hypothetical protein